MDIKSFLKKLWNTVASLFQVLPADLQQAAHIAVFITERLKTLTDSPLTDVITFLIPGDADDKIVSYIRTALPVIIKNLRLIISVDDEIISDDLKIIKASDVLRDLSGDVQSAFLHDLAVMLIREIAAINDHGLSWSDAVIVIEWYYQHKFKPVNG